MFAFFGLGWAELIVLGLIALFGFGASIVILVIVLSASKGSKGSPARTDEVADLRAEVQRLRDEIERLKKVPGSSTNITS